MNSTIDVLFLRHPAIDYRSPPICEVNFSSSSGPIIVLNPLTPQSFPTGLVLGGVGGFELSWNTFPGALCYSVYRADPGSTTFIIVAECIPNPPIDLGPFGPGVYVVTAITLEGETPPSASITIGGGGMTCPQFLGPAPDDTVETGEGEDTILGPVPVDEGGGGGVVTYEWWKNGVFFLDTTTTTKNELEFNAATLADAGTYALHIGNDHAECAHVSENIELIVDNALWDITWDAPIEFPGSPLWFSNVVTQPAQFHISDGQGPIFGGGSSGVVILNGSQTFTGPSTNCNLHLVITGTSNTVYGIEIKVDAVSVLSIADTANSGTYDFPFTVPASIGAAVTISIQSNTGTLFLTSNATFDGFLQLV